MTRARRWSRRAGLSMAGALLVAAPVVIADETDPGPGPPELRPLVTAAAWGDVLESYRVPELPPPGDTESVIVLLSGPAAGAVAPERQRQRAAEVSRTQQRIEQSIAGIGGVITFRYRMLINAVGVRVPTGRTAALAKLPSVRAIVPVSYLAPAAEPESVNSGAPLGESGSATASGPAHIALIDGGIDPTHPWLGGGVGPTYPILGGVDLVEGDADPSLSPRDAEIDSHGTRMASIVLRAPALADLPPEQRPRLISYRVVAAERVEGRTRPLARTDRVLAALDRAIDPNGDGSAADAPEVILLGLSRGFDGVGYDPISAAVNAADRLGSLVVVPAGNDGPTLSRSGSVGGPAASAGALVVGGLGAAQSPRAARLNIGVGQAEAATDPLPLLGGELPEGRLPITFVERDGVPVAGDQLDQFADATGRSVVTGTVAVVVRGGASLHEKARAASQAGALALVVWDREGPGVFPGLDATDWPIPVLGMGAAQGAALRRLADRDRTPEVWFSHNDRRSVEPGVAGFSSRGPTADARVLPHVIAPAVAIEAAVSGLDGPRSATLTGTSAAAAQVAAEALRLRIDRPVLSPADVRSLIVANARPIDGAGVRDQGAGVSSGLAAGSVVFDPPLISMTSEQGQAARATVSVRSLSGRARYQVALERSGEVVHRFGPARRIGPIATSVDLELPVDVTPGSDLGEVVVRDASGRIVGRAPTTYDRPVSPGPALLPAPEVSVAGGAVQVAVDVGQREIDGNRLKSVRLYDVRLWLVPGSGDPILVGGEKQPADWPAGRYRFVLAQRLPSGTPLPSGRFRLRVTARGPDGAELRSDSATFLLS